MWLNFDPLYWMMILPCMAVSGICTLWVKSAFSKYSAIPAQNGMTGAEIARAILSWNHIGDVRVEETQGFLGDHYDPSGKVLRLSPDNFHGRSIAALGVAAHEVGHAIQHASAYTWLQARTAIVPMAMVGSHMAWIFVMLGVAMQMQGLAVVGVVLFGVATIASIITLPVEFNASSRALATLEDGHILTSDELVGARAVLRAAAATYVAAAITAVVTLLYFLMRSGLLGRREE